MQLNNWGHVKFIEKPSRVLKSTSAKVLKGNRLEQAHSKIIHNLHTPILVSSKTLRQLNCGQVDVCAMRAIGGELQLIIYEVKSCPESLGGKQIKRLRQSLVFLLNLFDANGKIEILNNLPKE